MTAPEKMLVLAVEFASPDGRSCDAIGGGRTVTEALIWARESCSADANWETVRWDDLYGE